MPRQTWLMRREGVYYVRARVPKDLIDAVGKAEIRRSLKTNDPKEANRRLRKFVSEIQAQFDAARHQGPAFLQPVSNPDPPTREQLRAIVRAWFSSDQDRAAEAAMAPAEGDLAERLENLDYDLSMVSDLDNPSVGTHEVVANGVLIVPAEAPAIHFLHRVANRCTSL